MDDLQTLRAALLPAEPTPDVVDRSRHRLRNRMLAAPRPRRVRPLVIGVGVVAAAAAVVVATLPATPVPAPVPPQAVVPVSTGQAILLAAAERAQTGGRTYWHVTTKVGGEAWEYWTKADGHEWYRGAKTHGKAVLQPQVRPFRMFGAELTLGQIQALPTEPAALRAWLTDSIKRSGSYPGGLDLTVLQALISLVTAVPAPPAVQAAAFRAIAAYPGVSADPDGRTVQLPGGGHLTIDPSTGTVTGASMYLDAKGAPVKSVDGDGYTVSGEWTDDLPK